MAMFPISLVLFLIGLALLIYVVATLGFWATLGIAVLGLVFWSLFWFVWGMLIGVVTRLWYRCR